MASSKGGPILLKAIPPRIRPQATDITAAAMWGVTLGVGALWMVQDIHKGAEVGRGPKIYGGPNSPCPDVYIHGFRVASNRRE